MNFKKKTLNVSKISKIKKRAINNHSSHYEQKISSGLHKTIICKGQIRQRNQHVRQISRTWSSTHFLCLLSSKDLQSCEENKSQRTRKFSELYRNQFTAWFDWHRHWFLYEQEEQSNKGKQKCFIRTYELSLGSFDVCVGCVYPCLRKILKRKYMSGCSVLYLDWWSIRVNSRTFRGIVSLTPVDIFSGGDYWHSVNKSQLKFKKKLKTGDGIDIYLADATNVVIIILYALSLPTSGYHTLPLPS